MNRIWRISPLALVLVGGSALVAQSTTGAMAGAIKDAAGKSVAGARVAIESPALFAPRILTTDANGEWRAPLLPPGNYTVIASKDGYQSAKAVNVRIGLGANIRQDLTIQAVVTQTTTVVVTTTAGEVDKTDTKASQNFSSDDLLALPGVDRSFYGAADLAPGLVTSRDGGSFSIRGGPSQQTNFRVNGVDVKDDYQGSLTGNYVIEDNIEDVQVILSPLNARNGRAIGGSVNVVTKSGGNDFAGSIRADLSRNSWSSFNSNTTRQDGATNDRLNRNYQVTLSGPVIKDRLWFSLGAILTPSNAQTFTLPILYPSNTNRTVRTGNANVDAVTAAGPGGGFYFDTGFYDQGKPYNRISDSSYYEGKITGAITVDHTLEFSFTKSKQTLAPRNPFGDGSGPIVRLAALGTQSEETKAWTINYRGLLSSSTFIEARYSRSDPSVVFPSGDSAYGTGEGLYVYLGSTTGGAGTRRGFAFPFGIGISPTPDSRANRSGNVNLKKFIDAGGQHELDLGLDYYEFVRGTSRQSGLRNLFFRVGGMYTNGSDFRFQVMNNLPGQFGQAADGVRGPAPSVIQYTLPDGTTRNKVQSIYANDQWTVNKNWNFMLGLRFDQNSVKDTDGAEVAKKSDVSPRFQARYDLKGDSQHLVTFTAARFYTDFGGGFTDAFIKKADAAGVTRGWNSVPVNPGTASDPTYGVRFVDYNTLTNLANYGKVLSFFDSSKTYQIDPSLGSPYLDELTLGYRRTYSDGSHIGMTFVHRTWKNDWAFKSDYQPDQFVNLPDPTGSGLPSLQGQIIHVTNSDELKREYNGLEMEWLSKINATWVWGGNFTYSRLVGNNNGGDQGSQSFRDNATPGIFYNRNQLTNVLGRSQDDYAPVGPLLSNSSHRGRIYLTASLPVGQGKISYSWLLRYDGGYDWSAATTAPLGFTQLPSPAPARPQTYTQFYGGRGQYAYNDTYQVDFKIDFSVPLGFARSKLIGSVQVNNLFNTQMVSTYNTSIYAATAGTSVLYVNDPTQFGTTQPGQGIGYSIGGRSLSFSLGLKF